MDTDPVLPDNPTQAQVLAWCKEMERDDRYFVKADVPGAQWTEVTRAEFGEAERKAGFHSKYGHDLATAGFSGGGITGTIMAPSHWDNPHAPADIKAQFGP